MNQVETHEVIGFTGSRTYSNEKYVRSVIETIPNIEKYQFVVGDAIGADALVIKTLGSLGLLKNTFIWSVADQQGEGVWRGTAVAIVLDAQKAGATVIPSTNPESELNGRLVRRSIEMIYQADYLIGFPEEWKVGSVPKASWISCGSGTWSSLRMAAGMKKPIAIIGKWSKDFPWSDRWVRNFAFGGLIDGKVQAFFLGDWSYVF